MNSVRNMRRTLFAALMIGLVAVTAASGGERSVGSLSLHTQLANISHLGSCPPEAPPGTDICGLRGGSGSIPGLGLIAESYSFYLDTDPSCGGGRALQSAGRLEVAGKGTLLFVLERSDQCAVSGLRTTQRFTIAGGSGIYAGASGSGTMVYQDSLDTGRALFGTDTWTGTLTVAGLEFDLTPPTLGGLVNRTVRAPRGAKRARVKYSVTARDLVDRSVPAACRPKSGSRFRIGRTVVRCSASDTSGNTATGRFTVAVKRRR